MAWPANQALARTAGSHALTAAAHRERSGGSQDEHFRDRDMSTTRNFAIILLIAIPTALDARDDTPDPATLKDKVTIAVGKKLVVEFEQKGDALTHPKVVEKPGDKPPTPSFDFRRMGDNLILSTKNPFTKDLKFRALARLKGRKDYFETSIVPVKTGLFGIELWQDPIEELILFDFKLTDAK
jgi:hypothetical protein